MCNARIHDSQHRFGVDLTPPGFNITPLGVKKHIISLLGVTFFFLLYFNTNWCCSSKKSAPVRCETVFQSIGVKLPENFLQCIGIGLNLLDYLSFMYFYRLHIFHGRLGCMTLVRTLTSLDIGALTLK